jgi:hypothetical protein
MRKRRCDETIKPDLSKVSDELKKVYGYIDDHVENLQKWIRQPSISNSGEGIPESAEIGILGVLGVDSARDEDAATRSS